MGDQSPRRQRRGEAVLLRKARGKRREAIGQREEGKGRRQKVEGQRLKVNKRTNTISRFVLLFLISTLIVFLLTSSALPAEKIGTKVIVRVVARDGQVIGSGVGGALVRIKNVETGEILAEGKQEGGTGSTERIMVQPRRRGETVYGTSVSAYFEAKILLDRPIQGRDWCGSSSWLSTGHSKGFKDAYAHPWQGCLRRRDHHRTERVDCEHPESFSERELKGRKSGFGEG